MNIVDVMVVLLLLLSLFLGWKMRGTRLSAVIGAILLGAWSANHFQPRLLEGFQEHVAPQTAAFLAWFTPFLITSILVFILGMMIAVAFEAAQLKWLDHLSGATLAGTLMLALMAFGLNFLQTVETGMRTSVQKAIVTKPLLQTAQPILQAGEKYWPSLEKALSRQTSNR